jgi:hypothetical protein
MEARQTNKKIAKELSCALSQEEFLLELANLVKCILKGAVELQNPQVLRSLQDHPERQEWVIKPVDNIQRSAF